MSDEERQQQMDFTLEQQTPMTTEVHIFAVGETVLLRSGPYAGQTGTVVSVHPYRGQTDAGPLMMVKLANGRINSCYMDNLA